MKIRLTEKEQNLVSLLIVFVIIIGIYIIAVHWHW
jgi:hypothetical protein